MTGPINEQHASDKSAPSFYHYTLIRKIPVRPEGRYSYMVTALLLIVFLFVIYSWTGVISLILAMALIVVVHASVLRITLRRVDIYADKKWRFRRDWPWVGPLPIRDTQLALFRRLHFHLLIVGFCVVGLLYPWGHSSLIIASIYWHIWLLTPRLQLLWKLRKERAIGIIRLEATEVSYYHQ